MERNLDKLGLITLFGEKKTVYAIQEPSLKDPIVKFQDDQIEVYISDASISNVSLTLDKNFTLLLKNYIHPRILYFQDLMQLKPKKIIYGKSLKNWGTCNSQGIITFNTSLYKLSKNQIDYIIVHELAHLKHMNHDRSFWRLVGSVIKDYKTIMDS